MKIPDETIQDIRDAADIVDIVSQHVTLRKRGKAYMGLCPFHTEKTPSFSVDPDKGFYHCFGCGAGGNVFTFVMKMEGVTFVEAVRSLAEKTGIPLPALGESNDQTRETERLYRANQFAASFFQRSLHKTENGRKALGYLEKRGFSIETIKAFQIGFAPDRWDGLMHAAACEHLQVSDLERAGLVVPRKDGSGFYDRFRGRLMFPIHAPSGRVVGFGGRILKKDEKGPKYINSPETPVYRKSKILYGLHQSKAGIRREDQVLLVEGYTDVMRLQQNGFDYAVASSGTALTDDQARLMMRYTQNAVLVYDGDSAGFTAALRGTDILIAAGLKVIVAPLPSGSDPDTYLREQGPDQFSEHLRSAQTVIDFRLDRLHHAGKLETPSHKAAAARRILETIAAIRDPVERNLMVKDISEKLGIDEAVLVLQLRQSGQTHHSGQPSSEQPHLSARQSAEQGLVMLLLEDASRWAKKVFQFIQPQAFTNREARLVAEGIYDGFLQNAAPDADTLMNRLSSDPLALQYLSDILSRSLDDETDRVRFGVDCLWQICEMNVRDQIAEISQRIRSAEKAGSGDLKLKKQYIALRQDLKNKRQAINEAWEKDVEI